MTDRVLPRALRNAAPLFAGHGVVLVSGFLLQAALVAWVFRDHPERMARIGLLSQALQWVAVAALVGLPAGLLRHVPARPGEEKDLLATAQAAVLVASVALAALTTLVPGLRRTLLGEDEAAGLFRLYAWRVVPLAQIVLAASWLHARGRLVAKSAVEATERVLILGLALSFALADGLPGYVRGTLAASAVVAAVAQWVLGRRGRVRTSLLPALLRVGTPQLVLGLLETARPLVLLGLATRTVGDLQTGLLATAMGFSLPLIALPELAAQALFPGMHGPRGEGGHVPGEARRMLRELLLSGVVVLALYGAAAAWLLPLAGHGKYAGAVAALVALLPGVLAQGVASHAGYVLLVRDRLASAAGASAAALGVTAVLAWRLMPGQGAVGAAIALSVGALVRTSIVLLAARGEPPAAAGA